MLHRTLALASVTLLASALLAQEPHRQSAERGALAVRGKPTMNPPVWSAAAFDNVWKVWGLKEKPADFAAKVRERYGLHEAPYDNADLPMGLHYSNGLFGKGVINDCLLCHAGNVAGQTVIGLGNASLDIQTMFDDFSASASLPYTVPIPLGHVRGVIDPINPVVFLMTFRDAELNVREPVRLEYSRDISSDPPAWWLLKRKTKTRNWNGGVSAHATRVDMANLLTPFNSAAAVKKHEMTFADIHAFVLSVEAPKYPFPVDAALAEKGKGLFNETCARCHGTYGPGGEYPNKVVPVKTLGTDPRLTQAVSKSNLDIVNKSWLAQEKGPDGKPYTIADTGGYQAPPLDGVWATAPYLHNASVPTLYHVLDSKSRPTIFTRSYRTGKEDYDTERVGWKITVLDKAPGPEMPVHERRKAFDSTRPGLGNAGHTFGDEFTPEQRRAVIEYLKTL